MRREEAIERLEDLAGRWETTPEWHEPEFHDGRIHIDTGDLHAIAMLLPGLLTTPTPAPQGGAEVERLEREVGELVDIRDRREDQLAEIAAALGCRDEWSNLHDHGDCALELAERAGTPHEAVDVLVGALERVYAEHCECRPLRFDRATYGHSHDCDTGITDDIERALAAYRASATPRGAVGRDSGTLPSSQIPQEQNGELERLRAFAMDVFHEHDCTRECEEADDKIEGTPPGECPCGGDECWRCAAAQAIKPPSWAVPSAGGGRADEPTDGPCDPCGAPSVCNRFGVCVKAKQRASALGQGQGLEPASPSDSPRAAPPRGASQVKPAQPTKGKPRKGRDRQDRPTPYDRAPATGEKAGVTNQRRRVRSGRGRA